MDRSSGSVVALVTLGIAVSVASAQSKGEYNPTRGECIAKAQRAADVLWLSHRPTSEVNELDWQLSVCEGKFIPLKPQGAMLISEAHGAVADELRKRLEKALATLSPQMQKQFWDAFNSNSGASTK